MRRLTGPAALLLRPARVRSAPPNSSSLSFVSRCVVVVFGVGIAISACSAPTAPDSFTSAPLSSRASSLADSAQDPVTARRVVGTAPLANGTFTIRFDGPDGAGGTVTGTYTGQASVPETGKATASLDFSITGSSGFGSNVTAVSGEGTGGFAGEGDTTLSLTLVFSTPNPSDGLTTKTMIRGSSAVSCVNQRIVVTLSGTESTPRLGQVNVTLRHEVAGGGCSG